MDVSAGEGCGELMEQRVWELASARLGQCSSFISNGKPFVTGFRPMLMKWELCHGNIYVVLKSERDWTEGTRDRVTHVEVAVISQQVLKQFKIFKCLSWIVTLMAGMDTLLIALLLCVVNPYLCPSHIWEAFLSPSL